MNNLKKYRQFKGFTQSDFASAIGTTKNTVSNWENGASTPNVYDAIKIMNVLGEDIQELFPLENRK